MNPHTFGKGDLLLEGEELIGQVYATPYTCCCNLLTVGSDQLAITNHRVSALTVRETGCLFCCPTTDVVYYSAWLKDSPSVVIGKSGAVGLLDVIQEFICGALCPTLYDDCCRPAPLVIVGDTGAIHHNVAVSRNHLVDVRASFFGASEPFKHRREQRR
eukprot:TRINITY_DN1660_c0_g5_i1.p1 TRINITY_DN1660_c0_g5~~TRINITY_DN1660_c0_g5_i1.p1  ORF type:complete len:159 (+),score=19.00 TRINITY_DN1660_c0_g5_i1:176-652(+)